MVKRAVTEAHRRSARISALEEKARLQPKQNLAATSSSPPAASRKRGRKRKSLQAVVTNSPYQIGEHGNSGGSSVHLGNLSSPQPLPNKQTLEFMLDIIQRKDKHEIFAQPVDGQEVVGYYDMIKEPMDFGTMRAKLQEGMYTSLNQFERDVFLISSNAMKFNSPNTVYYTEAQRIGDAAQRLFHTLRTAPEELQLELSRTRGGPGRKPQCAASDSNTRVPKSSSVNVLSLRRTNQLFLGPFHSNPYNGLNNNGSTSGTRDGTNLNSSELDRRMTYMPQTLSDMQYMLCTVLNATKFLVQVPYTAARYSDSLMRFLEDMGPIAKAVADKKLGQHPTEAPNNLSSTPSPFGMTSDRFSPNLSAFNPARLNGGFGNQMPYNFLSKASAASKGKMVCTDEGTNSFRQDRVLNFSDFRGLRPNTTNNRITGQDHMPNFSDFRGLRPNTTNNGITDHNLRGEEGGNSSRKDNVFGSPQEKTNNGSDNIDGFIATLNEMSNIQNWHNHAASGGYFPLTGHGGLPHPNPPPQNINRESYTWLLTHPEPPEPPSLPGRSSSKAAVMWNQNGGPNTGSPAGLNQNYFANAFQQIPNGDGQSSAVPGALNQNHGAKPMQPLGWQLPNGEEQSSDAPYALHQDYNGKSMQPLGWKLPNGEGPSSAPGYALDQNYGVKNMQPMGWKLPNGEGPSFAAGYALDQNYVGKNMQPTGWKLPNGEGSSSAPGYALNQNDLSKNMQLTGWKLPNGERPDSPAGYALDQNSVAKNMQPMGWKLSNGEGPSSAAGYTLDQNSVAKNMQPMGWKLPNGAGSSSAAGYSLDQNLAENMQSMGWKMPNGEGSSSPAGYALDPRNMQPMGWKMQPMQSMGWNLPNGEGSSSAASFGMGQNNMAKDNQPAGWMIPNRLGLGPSTPVSSEQKFMGSSIRAAQAMGWRQLNGPGMGSTSSAAALQQKYPEQSTQNAQPMEWKQPSSWSLPTMPNLSGLNGPLNEQITPMQQQLHEVPFNTMNFLGGAHSQGYQGQTNAQLLWNGQQSSVNGMPDLDLQL
ncbi:DNA-binding bromodomain-containing protein [Euphorbia peplus]|nr:DNA-binding bromodomain-containing protein [Euphorbia peplus]